jgi:nicotinic acid mononucleotide adenylyltransferase
MRIAYPGSFDPPTTAHIEIALSALQLPSATKLDFVLSTDPFAKDSPPTLSLDERIDILHDVTHRDQRLGVSTSPARLIADLSQGYDAVLMGTDKFIQLHDLRFYESPQDMMGRLQQLAQLIVVRRGDDTTPIPPDVIDLVIDPRFRDVSSTRLRAGEDHLGAPEFLTWRTRRHRTHPDH